MKRFVRNSRRVERKEYGPDLLLTASEVKDWFASFRPYDFYLYVLHDDNGQPFYVGKSIIHTRQHRVCGHIRYRKGTKSQLYRRINRLLKAGREIYISIAMFSAHEYLILHAEREYIEVYGRKCDGGYLENKALGGQGGPTGITKSRVTRLKLSLAHRGKIVSKETRLKIALSSRGRRHSESTKQLLRDVARRRRLSGYVVSDETRRKISESRKSPAAQAQLRQRWIPVTVNGKRYASYAEASRRLGIKQTTLYYRVKIGFKGYAEALR